jgi:hypothetical protein
MGLLRKRPNFRPKIKATSVFFKTLSKVKIAQKAKNLPTGENRQILSPCLPLRSSKLVKPIPTNPISSTSISSKLILCRTSTTGIARSYLAIWEFLHI